MGYRVGLIVICAPWLWGCVEVSEMLSPPPDERPMIFTINRPEADDTGTSDDSGQQDDSVSDSPEPADDSQAADDAVGDSGNDDTEGTGDDATDNGSTDPDDNSTESESPIFGGIGDIPRLDGLEPIITESGLTYIDIEEGQGEQPPSSAARVTVNYTGWLTDGTEFDSGEGISFGLDRVIAGWTEGVGSMRVGGSRRLLIPPDLGYGESGFSPSIPPNATLIFDVELLDVEG